MILLIGHQGEQVPGSSVGPIAQHRKGKMRHEDDHDLLSDKGCQKELHHQVGGPKEEDDKNVGADRYIDEKVVEEEAAKGAVQRKKDLKILDVVAGELGKDGPIAWLKRIKLSNGHCEAFILLKTNQDRLEGGEDADADDGVGVGKQCQEEVPFGDVQKKN